MKYLELVKGLFTADHEARAKQADPYVAYSKEANRLMLNLLPEPVVGPANNEIWYTTTDGVEYDLQGLLTSSGLSYIGPDIISNELDVEKQMFVIKFDGDVTALGMNMDMTALDGPAFPESNIETIILPNSITCIGASSFIFCSSLTSIAIPNSVTIIGEHAFEECASLTSVTIPNSVTSIGESAFTGCYSLTSIIIPNSVTNIGRDAFYGCPALTSITFEGTTNQWNSIYKGDDWNFSVAATYVQCSDGQVTL